MRWSENLLAEAFAPSSEHLKSLRFLIVLPRGFAQLRVRRLSTHVIRPRNMTTDQTIKCNVAIHTGAAAAAAIGAGLAQLPGSDNIALIAVQITMAIALGKVFDIQVSDTAGRG